MENLKIFANVIEDTAKDQIKTLMQQKAFEDQIVRVMPDVHAGKGCVIGFTSTIGDYVIPNVVGVDIGCGMLVCKIPSNVKLNFDTLDKGIRERVPSGRNVHAHSNSNPDTKRYQEQSQVETLKCIKEIKDLNRVERSLGSLGGGNHFIEIDIDKEGNRYLIVHSGSRNLGTQVANYYQNLAYKKQLTAADKRLEHEKEEVIAKFVKVGKQSEISKALLYISSSRKWNGDKNLAWLEGENKDNYLHDMAICQRYAQLNRSAIMNIIIKDILDTKVDLPIEYFETIHNYIDVKDGIVRKGAVSAKKGQSLLIPLNMRDGCILGLGKGNADWNYSAPHGAGRIMSRSKAKEQILMSDYIDSMNGIYTTSVNKSTLDEAPIAYKNMSDIIDVIGETVDIVGILKPVYNFKASE